MSSPRTNILGDRPCFLYVWYGKRGLDGSRRNTEERIIFMRIDLAFSRRAGPAIGYGVGDSSSGLGSLIGVMALVFMFSKGEV